MQNLISEIERGVPDPKSGLPDEVFYFVGRMTPFVNIDLLIKDDRGRIFFSWRDDPYSGTGWHLPGGIIRFKETISTRIKKVAKLEVGISLAKTMGPILVSEIIDKNKQERSHFISLLYECEADKKSSQIMEELVSSDPSKYLLFNGVPPKLLKWHKIYKKYF